MLWSQAGLRVLVYGSQFMLHEWALMSQLLHETLKFSVGFKFPHPFGIFHIGTYLSVVYFRRKSSGGDKRKLSVS